MAWTAAQIRTRIDNIMNGPKSARDDNGELSQFSVDELMKMLAYAEAKERQADSTKLGMKIFKIISPGAV